MPAHPVRQWCALHCHHCYKSPMAVSIALWALAAAGRALLLSIGPESPVLPSLSVRLQSPAVAWHIRHGQVSHTISTSSLPWCTNFASDGSDAHRAWDMVCFSSDSLPQAQIWEWNFQMLLSHGQKCNPWILTATRCQQTPPAC